MLQLKNIVKTYKVGDMTQNALNGISICFRQNEFVSILGQSGSGKTTMLNIIGGLDRYTSGDLLINHISTKHYKDADWDFYRNHSIGFVFQSYHLIPHQTVLSNVEMALTLAGVSKKERRLRAISILKKVGLENHIHKKPTQMSGGQMQRVAIARALINNPDILLADEPTGALDSETSVQIMELLKEIAKDKLVIMVTHNPELAERYSTRIVRLKDGKIVDDSNPYTEKELPAPARKQKKISMSFGTALSLSFHNLCTKKARTLLTSFAGSIGIIGIALILALSTGMNAYIENIQKETMASYPITVNAKTIDVSSIMGIRGEVIGNIKGENQSVGHQDGVYANYQSIKTEQMIQTGFVENNLTEFKKYLDDPTSDIHRYLGENGIVYTYNVNFDVYSYAPDGSPINSDTAPDATPSIGGNIGILNRLNSTVGSTSSSGASHFSELMANPNGQSVSDVVCDSYNLLYGNWPQNYNEAVLVLSKENEIDIETLYQLGIIAKSEYTAIADKIKNGETADTLSFSYEEICAQTFYLVPECDRYVQNENGTFSYVEDTLPNTQMLLQNAVELKISGIVRLDEDAATESITTTVAYLPSLTAYLIAHTNESAVIRAQEAAPNINVLTGLPFAAADDLAKATDAKQYLSSLSIAEKASFYKLMLYYKNTSGPAGSILPESNLASDQASMAAALDLWLANQPSQEILVRIYDEYMTGSTYEDNMTAFGKVSYDAPTSISIYTDSFENKDAVAACISAYNRTVDETAQISYTDYVALLTSSLTTIIDGISYVLVAFVSISLLVSCIMIGIITHISVMERTKEIGILRALGASKHNISRVFNAETFIVGCCSGIIGIGLSFLLLLPINSLIAALTQIKDLTAQLSPDAALILILISVVITVIGGLIPARNAAKKDPVVALRTE